MGEKDVYSIILFTLFKCKQIPEFASFSELVYSMDMTSFLTVCKMFGGTTIRIPTTDELELCLAAITMYARVNVYKQCSVSEAKEELVSYYKNKRSNTIVKYYNDIVEVMKDYEFFPRDVK